MTAIRMFRKAFQKPLNYKVVDALLDHPYLFKDGIHSRPLLYSVTFHDYSFPLLRHVVSRGCTLPPQGIHNISDVLEAEDLCKWFHRNGGDVDEPHETEGYTALSASCGWADARRVEVLLRVGANPNGINRHYETRPLDSLFLVHSNSPVCNISIPPPPLFFFLSFFLFFFFSYQFRG
ncbi:hypothetical protein F4818DRAFT_432225 [Hypoxylon cercidicola]|nr:hypothetical protein F4818DRAFT_432225 [Hypoxylon cercidicola]